MEPHPHLDRYYATRAERRDYLDALFDDCAEHYDWVNAVMSFGSGTYYRRLAMRKAGLEPGMSVLDVATGTGLVAKGAARIVGADGHVIGVDPSAGMLARAPRNGRIRLVRALGENLPFGDGLFDMVTMGFALRHVDDLVGAFREYRRVLRPGGRVLILEISRPRSRLATAFARLYLKTILPKVVGLLAWNRRAREMMEYYWETIEKCVPPDAILEAMRAAGLTDVKRIVWFGMSSEYHGRAD